MKSLLIFFFIMFVFAAGSAAQKNPTPIVPKPGELPPTPSKIKNKKIKTKKRSVDERLKAYFYGREIRPAVIVNNLYDGRRDEREEIIDISTHKIVWFHSFKETKIKIDGDLFSLEGKKTLNFVDGTDTEDVDFANNWDQIRLFKLEDRELIGIKMYNDPCTGIGCSVAFQLIYDLKTKTKTFFGTYKTNQSEVELYDFGNDGTPDYLAKTYDGGGDGVIKDIINIYRLYMMDENGNFNLRLDKNQKPYFIKRTFKAKDYTEIDKKFEQNWIEEIK